MAMLHRCLDSLAAMTVMPASIIVVFQGAEDAALRRKLADRHPKVTVIWAQRQGAAAARNAGAAVADACDLLLFVDDDCTVDPAWLTCYLDAFAADPLVAAAGGRVLPMDELGDQAVMLGLQTDPRPRLFTRRTNPVGTIDRTGNFAIRAEALRALGGFDEGLGAGTRFPAAEDTDLVYRAMCAGFRLRYLPEAIVYHTQWRSAAEAAAVERGYGLGLGAFLITHVRRGDCYALGLAVRIAFHLGLRPLLDGLVRRRPSPMRSGWCYLGGIALGAIKGLRRPAEHHLGPFAGS
jgi:GT2 family glycosyltransferase